MTFQEAFNLAVQHFQAGRLSEAESLCRKILAQFPDHAESMHLLGIIAQQLGRYDAAVQLTGRAIQLRPNWAEAIYNLGNALCAAGQPKSAVAAYRRAIGINPAAAESHNNLGNALRDIGQTDEAVAAYRQAILLRPDFPEAFNNLAVVLREMGRADEAITACHQAIAMRPANAAALTNLGNALRTAGRLDEAISAYRQAIAFRPHFAEALSNLGAALRETGQVDEAIATCRQATEIKPDYAEAFHHLGAALHDKGLFDQAIAACRQAIALNPGYAEAHYGLALLLLLKCDFAQGWVEHEWRWRARDFLSPPWDFVQPLWDGSDLTGRTLLLHAEQGLGDTLQFIRYVPRIAERGARVLLACPRQLHRLLQTVPGIAQLLAPDEPIPPFDVHCPLLSLPLKFGTTIETIPASLPYLQANSDDRERLRLRVESLDLPVTPSSRHSLRVGLAWAGNPAHRRDRHRSLPLPTLVPLGQVNAQFWSLQKQPPGAASMIPPDGLRLTDCTSELGDLADTAALIANLDLVISADTAVAHLAGAMGKPVWTLLPHVPDWRWMLDRADSPWYPSMRLFRQPESGDWEGVIRQVLERIGSWIAGGRQM